MKNTKNQVDIKNLQHKVINNAVLERLIKEVKQGEFAKGAYDKVHNRHNR